MKVKHMLQHHQRWWYDRSIPRQLQKAMGSTRFRLNLQTSDLKEALGMKAKCDALFALAIDKAKREVGGQLDRLEHVEILANKLRVSSTAIDPDGIPYLAVDEDEGAAALEAVEAPLRGFFLDLVNEREVKRLTAFTDPWLASIGHLAPNTLLERKAVIDKLIKWSTTNGVINVSRFTRDHAKTFTATLSKEPATVSKALQAPTSLWKYMKDEGVSVDPDIWKSLAPKKARRDKHEDLERPFSLSELKTLMNGPARADLKDAMTGLLPVPWTPS